MTDTYYSQYIKVNKDFDPVFKWDANNKEDLFMDFYPHQTFIEMIKKVAESFEHQKKSVWVSGSYGTGKSYASFTLEKLLEIDENKLNAYFDKYKNLIDNNIIAKIKLLRNKNVIVVTRTGTSNINSDSALCYGIQESVAKVLKNKGIRYQSSLKELIINKFESDVYFANLLDEYIENEYKNVFGGDKVSDLIDKLKNNEEKSCEIIIANILKVADEKGLRVININVESLKDWLKKIIEENNISILFIWDEFTEYITNNSTRLTGFQRIGELITAFNFALMVITHKAPTQIISGDADAAKKVSDRFNTDCIIKLPEEQGIKLMASAINISSDEKDQKEWAIYSESLSNRVKNLCLELQQQVKITEEEYRTVLPLHPYATLVLRVISEKFGSNQRSMFDFMKASTDKENKKGFIWFIENFGPQDKDNPFLTVDMLWDYFYTNGKDKLDTDSLNILSYYDSINPNDANDKIDKYQRRILKTILLLNVIQKIQGQQESYYTPNFKNIYNSFVGTNVQDEVEIKINKLKQDNIISSISIAGIERYTAMVGQGDETEIGKEKEKNNSKFRNTNEILNLLQDEEKNFKFDPTSFLNAKYNFIVSDVSTFKNKLQSNDNKHNIILILAFNKEENVRLKNDNPFERLLENNKENIIIDATSNFVSDEEKNKFIDYYTRYVYHSNKDKSQSLIYKANYTNNLKSWISKIENGSFDLYYLSKDGKIQTVKISTFKQVLKSVNDIVINIYPLGLEKVQEKYKFQGGDIHKPIRSQSIMQGINCELRGSLQAVGDINDILNNKNYFTTKPDLIASKIKVNLDEYINSKLHYGVKEILVSDIYGYLYEKPYGFRNEGAYGVYIGFLLKEYIESNSYKFVDSANNYFELNKENVPSFASSIVDVINEKLNSENVKIVSEPEELKKLFEVAKKTFNLTKCNNVGDLRDGLRGKMREYSYPLRNVEFSKAFETLIKKKELSEVINDLMLLLNNNDTKSENSIGISIGDKLLNDEKLANEFENLFTKDNVIDGIKQYILKNEPLIVELSKKIQDENFYLTLLKEKFTEDGNWLWFNETAEEQIKLTLTELKIIDITNEILSLKNNSIDKTVDDWIHDVSRLVMPFDLVKDQIKNENIDLYDFLDELYLLTKSGEIKPAQINNFYDKLSKGRKSYENYRNGEYELELFKTMFDSKLQDLTRDDVIEIFGMLQKGFTLNKTEWHISTDNKISEYRASKKKLQLIKKFKERTGYDNPKSFETSKKTPILIFVKDSDKDIAKHTFDIINGNGTASDEDIARYIKYVENDDFFTKLDDNEFIDRVFASKFLDDYSIILTNVNEVRNYLYKSNPNVSSWYNDYKTTSSKIKQMAEHKYLDEDYKKAYEKIDKMQDTEVKNYLKKLIKDNLEVGLSIIKSSGQNE